MRFMYDPETDILTVDMVEDEEVQHRFAKNFRVPGTGAILDLDAEGGVLAIEIMGATKVYGAKALAVLPIEGSEIISLAEAARQGGISIDALKFAAQRGRLGARKIGRNWTTTPRDLYAYLENRKHAGPRSKEGEFASAEGWRAIEPTA